MKTPLFFCAVIMSFAFSNCKKDNLIVEIPKDIVSKKKLDPYTEVQYGNMPLIISVPHGGIVSPNNIPDRSCPNITTVTDGKTNELLNVIDSIFKIEYGIQPYFVTTYLKRTKLDQNREIIEATCGNNSIENIWNNYHLSIDTCITKILQKYPQVLFIDLHGHGHTKQRLELGYLINGNNLRNPNAINPNTTSYYNQLLLNPFLSSNQFVLNNNAFGTLMANKNFPSVPSIQDAAPLVTDDYFDGGYNTQIYTSALYPKVFGWQLETNFIGIRDNNISYILFAKAFTKSILKYFDSTTNIKTNEFGK